MVTVKKLHNLAKIHKNPTKPKKVLVWFFAFFASLILFLVKLLTGMFSLIRLVVYKKKALHQAKQCATLKRWHTAWFGAMLKAVFCSEVSSRLLPWAVAGTFPTPTRSTSHKERFADYFHYF